MIDLVEFLWNLSFSIASFLVQSLLALRKAMSMAVSSKSPTPASPPLPWKRFSESPLLASKRSKESPVGHRPRHADDGAFVPELHQPWRRELVLPFPVERRPPQDLASCHGDTTQRQRSPVRTARIELPAASARDEGKVGCPRARRRPTRIVIPETDVVSGFGEVGKVETNGEFQAEGSCYCVAGRRGNRRVMEDGYGVITNIKGDPKQAYFGVFDGHGGRAAVDYVSEKLGENIIAALGELDEKEEGDPEMAIIEGYLTTDREFLTKVRLQYPLPQQ
ncbi:hypothetical protein Taro_055889 [Colocasia esculenta]|uniref:protein-serine/threonine phosphatase n=1 Tax=Colocasia esculenta TaxID=4460 RepID=A0A843XUY2_COLES|nr:hypothetical protein [Colocasia esculenta]